MKRKLLTTCFVIGTVLAPAMAYAADSDTDRSKPATFVKDSAITTAVKTKLAADHPSSLVNIRVDTDMNGVVWLSGTAHNQADIDKAVTIARNTEGVKSVHNDVKLTK